MKSIVYRNMFSMGTRLELVFPGIDEDTADIFFSLIKTEMIRLEEKISIYKETSAFSILNHYATGSAQQTDSETFKLIEGLIHLSEKTFGYFDFTMGKNLAAREFSQQEAINDDKLAEYNYASPAKKISLNESLKSVLFENKNVSLDSGGFGKGLGLDHIRKILNDHNQDSAFISFGSSSVFAKGKHPYGQSWKTGITDLFNESENVYVYDLRDAFMSVSGNTPANLKKYNAGHIINPLTGEPVEEYFQCAVSGPNGMTTEVISTALCCAPEIKRDELMNNFPGYNAVIIQYNHNQKPEIIYSYNNKQ